MIEKRITTTDRALTNFDEFYGNVYGNRWKSMRLALLCKHKYIAMVNNYGDPDKIGEMLESDGAIDIRSIYEVGKKLLEEDPTKFNASRNSGKFDNVIDEFIGLKKDMEKKELFGDKDVNKYFSTSPEQVSNTIDFKKPLEKVIAEDSQIDYNRLIDPEVSSLGLQEFVPATKIKGREDFIPESQHYSYYTTTNDFPLNFELVTDFKIPSNLKLYTYEKCNISSFRTPRRTSTGVSSHILIDGASILPPLALQIQPGDYVYDACAAPGGKSLVMLQTNLPKILVANDVTEHRCNRIRKMMKEFIYDFESTFSRHRCLVRMNDAAHETEYGNYDKVLVDVPCTTDRHSVMVDENNIFRPDRVKERLKLPEIQSSILTNCIRLLKPGGSLVYSTCSLSPVQNDGVVHMSLARVFKEYGITVTINDMSHVMKPFQEIMRFENPKGLKYGQMVIPFLPSNFGPMYFCKMTRN
jgi:5-methylcytosine rRNA methyltransferase NSUN4